MADPSPQLPATDTLLDLLRRGARHDPDKPALLASSGAHFSHAELLQSVEKGIAQLRERGVTDGDRVAVVLPPGTAILHAFLSIGSFAVFAPLNPDYTSGEFDYSLKEAGAKFLLTREGFGQQARIAARDPGPTLLEITASTDPDRMFQDTSVTNPSAAQVQTAPQDIALLLQTSGTTSRPKLVPLSHANLVAATDNIIDSLSLGPQDRCLNLLPPFHIGALVDLLLAPLASGGSVVVAEDAAPETVFRHLLESRPTWIQAVPTMLHDMVRHRPSTTDRFFSDPANNRLRFIRSVSSALPESLRREVEETGTRKSTA